MTSTPTASEATSASGSPSGGSRSAIEFIDEVPKTSVGKFDKKLLRARFAPSEAAAVVSKSG